MRLLARHFRRTQENTAYSLEQTFVKQGGRCIPAMNDGAFSPFSSEKRARVSLGGRGRGLKSDLISQVFQAPHQAFLQSCAFMFIEEVRPQVLVGDMAL